MTDLITADAALLLVLGLVALTALLAVALLAALLIAERRAARAAADEHADIYNRVEAMFDRRGG